MTEEVPPAPCDGHKTDCYTCDDNPEGNVSERIAWAIVDAEPERDAYDRHNESEETQAHWLRGTRKEPIEPLARIA
jgi:hypothetical protein